MSDSKLYLFLNYAYSLKHLKYLSKVVLLGCLNVKDPGIVELVGKLQYLEELDLGGTNITSYTLREMV